MSAPTPTVEIESADDLSALVSRCAGRGEPIIDYGLAHDGLGHPPPAPHVALVQRGDVIEHYERDMTVRAAAGTTMGRLNEQLTKTGQFLPIDADPDLTLGEILCHNVYGPLRVAYGSIRDLLLGLRYVDGLGRQIHAGGRTVKNVAGYDVGRFMVGSLGQMGLVYEATLRTFAIPPRVFTVELKFADPAVMDGLMKDWLLSDAAPGWLLLNMADGHAVVRVGYLGRATACEVQVRSLEELLKGRTDVKIMGTARRSLEQDAQERAARRRWRREATGLCKLVVPPAVTGSTCRALRQWAEHEARINIDALPVHGCIFAGGTLDAVSARNLDVQVGRLAEKVGGLRVWYRRPESDDRIEPFGPPRRDFSILTALKRTMDPQDLFNPGRYLPAGKAQS